MSLLSGFNISLDEIKLLEEASGAAFAGGAIPPGWNVITPAQLGLAAKYQDGIYFTDPSTGSSAIVLQQDSRYIVAFRGTDGANDIAQFPGLFFGNYINNFQPLLSAVANVTPAGTQVYFTGASLGGGATNLMANIAQSQYGGHFAGAKFVAFASPNISNANGILNVGVENDPVYKAINNYADFPSSLDNLVLATPEYLAGNYDGQHPFDAYAHGASSAADALNGFIQSIFVDRMNPDSVVIFDAASGQVVQDITPGRENTGAFYIGRPIDDQMAGRNGSDFLEGFAGNDMMNGGAGNDFLSGGAGQDTMIGGPGADTFFFLSASAVTDAQSGIYDTISDFDQGNFVSYIPGEGDQLDVSNIVSGLYNLGHGQPVSSLVRLAEDSSNTFALLQVDPEGSGASGWLTVARLNGIHLGDTVSVVLDPSLAGGSQLVVQGPSVAVPVPVPVPVEMVLRSNTSGAFALYDLGHNAILGAYSLGQVGLDFQLVGLGTFFGSDTSDMLLRDRNTGAFELYDVSNHAITSANSLGQVGLELQVFGFGNFSSRPGETDMLMRNPNTGAFALYDIANNQVTGSASLGVVAPEWRLAGFGSFGGNAGETDMLLRNSNTGAFEFYNIANNQITNAVSAGQVGLELQVVGFGNFSGNPGATDMLMRDIHTGAFTLYDIAGNQIVGSAALGQVGLESQVVGFGNFSGNPGETDMLMRDSHTGAFEVYDLANNHITGAAALGQVGLEWQVFGFADISGNPGEGDMLLRNSTTGAFEVYDIAGNAITSAASLGQVGLEWQPGGLTSDATTSQLIHTMAAFAPEGLVSSVMAAPGADTAQSSPFIAPSHSA